ncbi:urease accessory protein UreF [Nakamurella silvestris]|nr:urease accessory protein UreF [Nakamurella silvestris]
MLLADARLPTGAHTQSAGLEPALNAGMPITDVPRYIRTRLRTVARVEAGTAVVTRHLCLSAGPSGGPADLAAMLAEVQRAWAARTISPALRETAVLLGRGYLRLAGRLWPESVPVRALTDAGRGGSPCRAVVLGAVAAETGLSGAQLARLIGYDEAQTIAAAALKLAALDPVSASQWVLGVLGEVDTLVAATADLTAIDEIPATGAPLVEEWAQIHTTAAMRLFRA